MSKGVILFAFNSPKFNYYDMAVATAKRANHFLNLPVNQTWQTHSLQISPDYCAAIATPCYVVKIKTHPNFIFT